MPVERILIAAKTYPTLSRKYGETVCTAGVRQDGSWIRLYPVPFRRLNEWEQYRKFEWIECQMDRNDSDPRPETYRPGAFDEIRRIRHVDTSDNWRERRRIFLDNQKVYTRLQDLIDGAKSEQRLSLAVFKPTRVIKFFCKLDGRDWDHGKLDELRRIHGQLDLFDDDSWRRTFEIVRKLPYRFSYQFEDETGRKSNLRILDWETGALYWNCLQDANGDEKKALEKVRDKYFNEFLEKDLHFFVGTLKQFHFRAPNPWVIIGVFPIPHERRLEFL